MEYHDVLLNLSLSRMNVDAQNLGLEEEHTK